MTGWSRGGRDGWCADRCRGRRGGGGGDGTGGEHGGRARPFVVALLLQPARILQLRDKEDKGEVSSPQSSTQARSCSAGGPSPGSRRNRQDAATSRGRSAERGTRWARHARVCRRKGGEGEERKEEDREGGEGEGRSESPTVPLPFLLRLLLKSFPPPSQKPRRSCFNQVLHLLASSR